MILGSFGVVFFLATAILSAWAMQEIPHPLLAAILVSSFSSAFVLCGVWTVLGYFRESLSVNRVQVTQRGVIRTRIIQIDDVTGVRWPRVPSYDALVIRTQSEKVKIYLNNFTAVERKQLISFFRGVFSPKLQERWEEFESGLLRLQRRPDRSRSAAVMCALLFFLLAGGLIYCWNAGLGVRWLVIGVANVVVGLWYVWRICKFEDDDVEEKTMC